VTASTDPNRATDNLRASPLAGWSSRFASASAVSGQFAIREVPFQSQVNLRVDAAASGAKVASVLDCELPLAANTWNAGGEYSALWLGPDEWLVVAPEGHNDALGADLRMALAGVHHSVTDLSANRTIIEISGTDARVVLAKGCPLDLHGTAFKPPQCAQTLLAKSQMVLQCVDARPVFRVFVRISFAPYVAEWLLDAAAELAASRNLDTQRISNALG
jgi:sarcosine oxidase subunit gamma